MGHGARLKCTSTRAACARPGPSATPFPGVSARMQPSDSLPPLAVALVPLASGLPRYRRLFCAPLGPTTRAPANMSCVGDGSPVLRDTGIGRGEARASQVPGPSSSYVPWSNTPPETCLALPTSRRGRWGLQSIQPPGHPGSVEVAGPPPHGPHARVPTLRQPCFEGCRKARYRLGRAHPWSDGICTRWTTHKVS